MHGFYFDRKLLKYEGEVNVRWIDALRIQRIQGLEVRMKRQYLFFFCMAKNTGLTGLLFWILAPDF